MRYSSIATYPAPSSIAYTPRDQACRMDSDSHVSPKSIAQGATPVNPFQGLDVNYQEVLYKFEPGLTLSSKFRPFQNWI